MKLLTCYLSDFSRSRKGIAVELIFKSALVVIALIAVYMLVSSAISGAQRISTGLLNKCPDGNIVPVASCYCDGKQVNLNIGKPGFEPQFCCDGSITTAPCPCKNINSCASYKTEILERDKQERWCNDNICSKYFGDGNTLCEWTAGSCVPETPKTSQGVPR